MRKSVKKCQKEVLFTTFYTKTGKPEQKWIPTYSGIAVTVLARTGSLLDPFLTICVTYEVSFGVRDPEIGTF